MKWVWVLLPRVLLALLGYCIGIGNEQRWALHVSRAGSSSVSAQRRGGSCSSPLVGSFEKRTASSFEHNLCGPRSRRVCCAFGCCERHTLSRHALLARSLVAWAEPETRRRAHSSPRRPPSAAAKKAAAMHPGSSVITARTQILLVLYRG